MFGFIKKIKEFLVSADRLVNEHHVKPDPDSYSLKVAMLETKVSALKQENHELKRTIEVMETLTGISAGSTYSVIGVDGNNIIIRPSQLGDIG